MTLERYKKALALALYYVNGDATYEGVQLQVNKILAGEDEVKSEGEVNNHHERAQQMANTTGVSAEKRINRGGEVDEIFKEEHAQGRMKEINFREKWSELCEPAITIHEANRIHREWLERQQKVYQGEYSSDTDWTTFKPLGGKSGREYVATKEAYLVGVTEIEADSAERVLADLVSEWESGRVYGPADKLNLLERARRLLEPK